MNRKTAYHFSLFIGLIAFTIVYCTIKHLSIPLLRYYPTLNQWSMIKDPDIPSMGWYAQTLVSLCIGSVCGAIAYLIGSLRRLVSERVLVIVGWMAVAAAGLMMLYLFQREWQGWIAS